MKSVIVKVNSEDKLSELDSISQTLGCRHTNPDICSKHSLNGLCAFVRNDSICKNPPRTWKKKYESLLSSETRQTTEEGST